MRKNRIFLIAVAVFLGVLIGIQIRTINKNTTIKTEKGVARTRELQELLAQANSEIEKQTKQIEDLNSKLNEIENNGKNKSDETKYLYDEIERLKVYASLTDVKGEGLEITISKPMGLTDTASDPVFDNPDYLLKLVSVLNAADAEAISINSERISSYSEIERAGDHIQINGASIAMPYKIKAIGDFDTMKSALLIKNGIADKFKSLNVTFNITRENNLTVEKMKKLPELNYSTSVVNEEKNK